MVTLKSRKDLDKMRRAGRVVAECHALVENAIRPGVTTGELDRIVADHLRSLGGRSAFLHYAPRGALPFPGNICTSVNEVVVHGICLETNLLVLRSIEGITSTRPFVCLVNFLGR